MAWAFWLSYTSTLNQWANSWANQIQFLPLNRTELVSKIKKYKALNDAIIELQPISDIFDKWIVNLDSALSSILWNFGDIWLTAWLTYYYRKVLKKHGLWNVFNDDVWGKLLKDYIIKRVWAKFKDKSPLLNKAKAKNWNGIDIWWILGQATELAMWNVYKAHEKIINNIKEAQDYIKWEIILQWVKPEDLAAPSTTIHRIQNWTIWYELKWLPKDHRIWIQDLEKATRNNIKAILNI